MTCLWYDTKTTSVHWNQVPLQIKSCHLCKCHCPHLQPRRVCVGTRALMCCSVLPSISFVSWMYLSVYQLTVPAKFTVLPEYLVILRQLIPWAHLLGLMVFLSSAVVWDHSRIQASLLFDGFVVLSRAEGTQQRQLAWVGSESTFYIVTPLHSIYWVPARLHRKLSRTHPGSSKWKIKWRNVIKWWECTDHPLMGNHTQFLPHHLHTPPSCNQYISHALCTRPPNTNFQSVHPSIISCISPG